MELTHEDFRDLINLFKDNDLSYIEKELDNSSNLNGVLYKMKKIYGKNALDEIRQIHDNYFDFKGGQYTQALTAVRGTLGKAEPYLAKAKGVFSRSPALPGTATASATAEQQASRWARAKAFGKEQLPFIASTAIPLALGVATQTPYVPGQRPPQLPLLPQGTGITTPISPYSQQYQLSPTQQQIQTLAWELSQQQLAQRGYIPSTPLFQPIQQPVVPPVQQPVIQPVQQPVVQPVQQPVIQPVQQPVTEQSLTSPSSQQMVASVIATALPIIQQIIQQRMAKQQQPTLQQGGEIKIYELDKLLCYGELRKQLDLQSGGKIKISNFNRTLPGDKIKISNFNLTLPGDKIKISNFNRTLPGGKRKKGKKDKKGKKGKKDTEISDKLEYTEQETTVYEM